MANDEVREPLPASEQSNSGEPENETGEISLDDADKIAGGPTSGGGPS